MGTISGFTFQPINAQHVWVNTRLSSAQETSGRASLGGQEVVGVSKEPSEAEQGGHPSVWSGAALPAEPQPQATPSEPKTSCRLEEDAVKC